MIAVTTVVPSTTVNLNKKRNLSHADEINSVRSTYSSVTKSSVLDEFWEEKFVER